MSEIKKRQSGSYSEGVSTSHFVLERGDILMACTEERSLQINKAVLSDCIYEERVCSDCLLT